MPLRRFNSVRFNASDLNLCDLSLAEGFIAAPELRINAILLFWCDNSIRRIRPSIVMLGLRRVYVICKSFTSSPKLSQFHVILLMTFMKVLFTVVLMVVLGRICKWPVKQRENHTRYLKEIKTQEIKEKLAAL